jgi:hypothetical protein
MYCYCSIKFLVYSVIAVYFNQNVNILFYNLIAMSPIERIDRNDLKWKVAHGINDALWS